MVEPTHLKNMLVKLEIFSHDQGENKKTIWNLHRSLKLVVSTAQLNKATYKNPMWPDHLGWTRDSQKMMGPMGRVADSVRPSNRMVWP